MVGFVLWSICMRLHAFFQLAKNNSGLPLFVLVPSPSEKPWFRRCIVVMLRFARTWTFWSTYSITDSMILSQCDWICSSVALYCFKLVRVQEPTHMHLALLHGYFRPISIKDHGMSEFTNQRAWWWHHVWLSARRFYTLWVHACVTAQTGLTRFNTFSDSAKTSN